MSRGEDDFEQRATAAIVSFRPVDDDVVMGRFYDEMIALANENPGALLRVGSAHLDAPDAMRRSAAVQAVGRAAELGDLDTAREAERVLLAHLRAEDDTDVVESLTAYLGRAWARQDRCLEQTPLLDDPDPRVRFAAARGLALSCSDPPTPEEEQALRKLLADDDERVRHWAQWGLTPPTDW